MKASITRLLSSLLQSLLVFAIESIFIYGIQKFLFPLEDYWISIVSSLFLYTLVEWFLIQNHRMTNIFVALDQGNLELKDTLLIIISPLLIAAVLSFTGNGLFIFLLPVLWVVFVIQSCISSLAIYGLDHVRNKKGFHLTVRGTTWFVSVFLAMLVYSLAFFSLNVYKPINPLLRSEHTIRGIWFTIPVNKSELFPLGYARLEDGVFDDLGHPFFAALGQTLGLVTPCKVPGPDTSRAVPPPDMNTTIQPKYHYAVDTLCNEWTETLPGFYWRIGLVGVFFLSLVLGVVILKDPIDFGLISVIMLFAWATWPVSERERMGNVDVLVAGMAFLALILPLMRRKRYSFLVIWGIFSGILFGLAGFVRQPCGYALMVTSLVTIVFAGIKYRQIVLSLTTLAALLAGNSLVPATLNGLFLYRDTKLQITAPSISPRVHGSGFALLGGVGGRWPGDSASSEYKNSLDMAFLDASIWFNLYNENPVMGFSYEVVQNTSKTLFIRYVLKHPVEFASIFFRKVYSTFILTLSVPSNWPVVSLFLFSMLGLRYIFYRQAVFDIDAYRYKVKEIVLVFIILMAVAALPAIVTTPYYGQSTYLPAAVLFFTAVFVVYYAFQSLFPKAGK